jgi:5-formyltetrahydrofolate cyclo-ligase
MVLTVLNMTVSKNVWRAKMLESRSQMGPEKASQLNRDICKNLSFVWTEAGGLGNPKNRPTWAGYKSFRWEADPDQAIFESRPYLQWAYPRVLTDHQMEFLVPASQDAQWLKNTWGLWEPDPRTSEKISLDDCAGVLVPGVAFDRNGHRLGYGKGFYDKALTGFKGLKVGVAFSLQIIGEPLPSDDTDITMDLVVTDTEIIRCAGSRH